MNTKGNAITPIAAAVASVLALASTVAVNGTAFAKTQVAARGSSVYPSAIIGTGTEAIIGTGTEAIIGTGTEAIIGTGTEAIIGTGTEAIIGTGTEAIIGTGTEAIIGTGRLVAVQGAIESIDQSKQSVRVLGREFVLGAESRLFTDIEAAYLGGAQVQVAVDGIVGRKGKLSQTRLRVISHDYVAGASEVVLSGVIRSVDRMAGQLVIGKTTVDFTATLAAGKDLALEAGTVISVTGTQPVPNGTILAERLVQFVR